MSRAVEGGSQGHAARALDGSVCFLPPVSGQVFPERQSERCPVFVHGHWASGPSVLWKPFLAKCVQETKGERPFGALGMSVNWGLMLICC